MNTHQRQHLPVSEFNQLVKEYYQVKQSEYDSSWTTSTAKEDDVKEERKEEKTIEKEDFVIRERKDAGSSC